jgi:hypothetical protein
LLFLIRTLKDQETIDVYNLILKVSANQKIFLQKVSVATTQTVMKRKAPLKQTKAKKLKPNTIHISEKHLNHYTFKKQGLTERSTFENFPTHFLPLHGTRTSTPFLSLHARIQNFDWKTLANEIHSNKETSTTNFPLKRCMRGTLHLIPEKHLNIIHSIYGLGKESTFSEMKNFKNAGFSEEEIENLSDEILKVLQEKGEQSADSIKKFINEDLINFNQYKLSNVSFAFKYLYVKGDVEYGSSNGKVESWRDSNRKYKLSTFKLETLERKTAIRGLAEWYFDLYGPASFKDFIWWSGLTVTECRKEVEKLLENYEKVSVDNYPEMFIAKDQVEELKETPDDYPSMIRFLPYEDAMVKAYKETRCRFFEEEIASKVISRGGELKPSLWMNGKPIGLFNWTIKENTDISIELFDESEDKDIFQEEIEILKDFLKFNEVKWE